MTQNALFTTETNLALSGNRFSFEVVDLRRFHISVKEAVNQLIFKLNINWNRGGAKEPCYSGGGANFHTRYRYEVDFFSR